MGSTEFGSTSEPAEANSESTSGSLAPEVSSPRPQSQVWLIALSAGVVAGLIAWIGGEFAHNAFKPQLFKVEVIAIGTTSQPSRESLIAADIKNATLTFAILGCVTGLAMGLAGGMAGRSPGRGVLVGLAAQAAGSIVGALACLALLPLSFRGLVPDVNDLMTPILIHGGIWMGIGAVGGWAFAVGIRSGLHVLNAVGAGCIGGFLASVFYHLLSGGLFPQVNSTEPVADSAVVRLLAMILVTVLVAVGAARGAMGRHHEFAPASGH